MDKDSSQISVSIIIVSWNARDYLKQCLESLTPAVCRYPMEIIVVDNASSDGSPELVENSFPRVRLIRNSTNLGFARGNNLGIRSSGGRYLCLVNSDIKVLPDCISRLVDYCEQHPEVGMAGPRIVGGDGKLQRSCRGFPTLWNMFCRAFALDTIFPRCKLFTGYSLSHWPQDSTRPVDILSGCFWLVRRETLSRVGLLDEAFFMYGEDMDWSKRFWLGGSSLAFVSQAEAIHHGGASSSNSPARFYIEKQRADLQYWKKHHSRVATAGYFLISCLHLLLRTAGYSLAPLFHRGARHIYQYKVKRSLACLKWLFCESSVAI
ncbi:MAG TPA: glycosyltransferase family 2 protein [Verrucomicrobiae bacterium]|nr:glycosyltransferase family 2 protein [Verrucomicrobiae bacterium]